MAIDKKPTNVEWMCTHCGKKSLMSVKAGRPMPGKCPRKSNDRPHTWVKNRTF